MLKRGYTLVELMVVLTILAIIGLVAFANLKTFSKTQTVDQAISEVQSFLRLAQSNATAGVICGTQGGAYWAVKFESNTQLKLRCGPTGVETEQKTLDLVGVQVSYSCPLDSQLIVTYAPLSGAVNLGSCSDVTITLTSTQDGQSKSFVITKGGAINVQ